MIQQPQGTYSAIGDSGINPVDPNNLQAVVGYDLWFPPNTGLLQFLLYPTASSTAVNAGGIANNSDGTASDSGLLVQGIVKDENGNPWYQVEDTTGQDGTAGTTYYVPATAASVPENDAGSTNASSAGTVSSSAPASGNMTLAVDPADTVSTDTQGTTQTTNTNTQSTGSDTTGSGSGAGNGIIPGSNGINAPWPTGLKIGLGLLGLLIAVVVVDQLSND